MKFKNELRNKDREIEELKLLVEVMKIELKELRTKVAGAEANKRLDAYKKTLERMGDTGE